MTLAELSNIRLSQLINVDASLISRFRSGVRTPVKDSATARRLAGILWERILRAGRKTDLAQLMRFCTEELDADYFTRWLYEFDCSGDATAIAVENLLAAFDSYPADAGHPLPSFREAAPDILLNDITISECPDQGEHRRGDCRSHRAAVYVLPILSPTDVPRLRLLRRAPDEAESDGSEFALPPAREPVPVTYTLLMIRH